MPRACLSSRRGGKNYYIEKIKVCNMLIIKGNSQRFQTFFTKGLKCVSCGIEGKYFAKEKTKGDKRYHLNLYAIDGNGKEVLMTKDHIFPHNKGGKNNISNYQTMCVKCNVAKGSRIL